MTRPLIAKSLKQNRLPDEPIPYSATLLGHIEQCVDVARLFNDYATASMVRACGSEDETHVEWFQKALLLAASTHDLGKASNSFEDPLIGKGKSTPYYVRHEVISYWILSRDANLRDAIQTYFASDQKERLIPFVEGAILSHHLKFPRRSVEMEQGRGPFYQGSITIYQDRLNKSGVMEILEGILGSAVELTELDPLPGTEDWLVREVKLPFNRRVKKQSYSQLEQMLGYMLRGALIAVDTIGSLQCTTRESWLDCLEKFRLSFQSRAELSQELKKVVKAHLEGKEIHPTIDRFQEQVAKATADIVIVEAGCGLGKTISAYKRASYLKSHGLFLSFPMTSVASQAFEEYALKSGVESQLLHSRSQVDMEFLLPQASEADGLNDDKEDALEDVAESLRRLMATSTFCTVDVVLGLLQMRRSSLCLLPALCQSMVVFDEVHSYSPELFKHLLAFARYFHLPMVMMTATLPPAYRMALKGAAEDKSLAWIRGPEDIETIKRYQVQVDVGSPSAELSPGLVSIVRGAVQAGRKVLIVLNQVNWAKTVYEQLTALPDMASLTHLLHSRFKYLHRRQIQQKVVGSFREHSGALIAVTTQICEISFDISADLLISNVAPFPAMVQRLGRLNRGHSPDSARLGMGIFTYPLNPKPYTTDELATGLRFVDDIKKQSEVQMSQSDLQNWLNELIEEMVQEKPKTGFTWFDEEPARLGNSLREAGYTMDIIMKSDFSQAMTPTDRIKFVLPLPLRVRRGSKERSWRHYTIVDDTEVEYSDELGGEWRHV